MCSNMLPSRGNPLADRVSCKLVVEKKGSQVIRIEADPVEGLVARAEHALRMGVSSGTHKFSG